MKAKLIFDLNDFDDIRAYNRANKSQDMAIVLFEISNNIKRRSKNLDDVFERIAELMEDNNIDLNELIE